MHLPPVHSLNPSSVELSTLLYFSVNSRLDTEEALSDNR